MTTKKIIAVFENEHELMTASKALKAVNTKIVDFYTPFPVHGLDDLLDIKRSRLPFVTFAAGTFGLCLAMTFQVWTSAVDWPINVGGKPMLSIPAFVPIAFEIMVLFGALTTVAAFFYRSNLFPTKEEEFIYDIRQLDDKFVAVYEADETAPICDVLEKFQAKINIMEQRKL